METVYQTVIQTICTYPYPVVYPRDLLDTLPFRASERSVRRYMVAMSRQGMLVRRSARGGYMLPPTHANSHI